MRSSRSPSRMHWGVGRRSFGWWDAAAGFGWVRARTCSCETPRENGNASIWGCLPSKSEPCSRIGKERLWIGSGGQGLVRVRLPWVEPILLPAMDAPARSVAPAADGGIWAGTSAGLVRWKQGVAQPYPAGAGMAGVQPVLETRRGDVWFGVDGRNPALMVIPPGGNADPLRLTGVTRTNVASRCLYQDRAGDLWVGTEDGLFRFANADPRSAPEPWKHRMVADGVLDARTILVDRRNRLWVGTRDRGLLRSDRSIRPITDSKDDTLHPAATRSFPLDGSTVYALHEDGAKPGTVWCATKHGLVRVRDDQVTRFGVGHGLFNETTHHLLEDDSGRFWISSMRGILSVSKQQLSAAAAGRSSSVLFTRIDEVDGLIDGETSGGYQPAGCRLIDGTFCFPSVRGVVLFDPANRPRDSEPGRTLIESVDHGGGILLAGWNRPPSAALSGASGLTFEIESGQDRTVAIQFTAPTFVHARQRRFRYRLTGFDRDWMVRRPDADRTVRYTNLDPGIYRFEVAGQQGDAWDEQPAGFQFRVHPTLWERPVTWAAMAIVVTGLAMAWHANRLRMRSRLHENEHQIAMNREVQRIMRDLHDSLGAEVSRLARLSERALEMAPAGAPVTELLGQVWKRCTMLPRWTLPPGGTHDGGGDLRTLLGSMRAWANEFLELHEIQVIWDWQRGIPALPITNLFRANLILTFRECLANAVRHSKTERIWMTTRFEADTHRLTLSIADNGVGFDVTADRSPGADGGHGLPNIRRRIADLEGEIDILSRPKSGTTIRIQVPVPWFESEDRLPTARTGTWGRLTLWLRIRQRK